MELLVFSCAGRLVRAVGLYGLHSLMTVSQSELTLHSGLQIDHTSEDVNLA